CCNTGREDIGSHTVCVVMTSAFLDFSKSHGNDLSTPVPQFGFPGLKPGDRWCLCAPRWQEAFEASQAPRVVLRATHEGALAHCSLADLKLSLPKTRFERTGDAIRPRLHVRRCPRSGRSGAGLAHPFRAKHEDATHYNRRRISQGSASGALR